jgi:hypothetical protein
MSWSKTLKEIQKNIAIAPDINKYCQFKKTILSEKTDKSSLEIRLDKFLTLQIISQIFSCQLLIEMMGTGTPPVILLG